MSLPEGFDNRYLVVKWEDISLLRPQHQEELDHILGRVENFREISGKPRTNNYIVVNTDEPYIDEIIEILKRHGHWG